MIAAVAGEVRLMVRLDPELHATLKQVAEAEDRSLNGQINRALREWLAARGPSPKGPREPRR